MAGEWRVVVAFDDAPAGGRPRRGNRNYDVAREMRDRLDGAVVEPDEPPRVPGLPGYRWLWRFFAWLDPGKSPVFAYVGTHEAAEEAGQVAREVTGKRGLAASVCVECWHPLEGLWADSPPAPRPTAKEARAMHARQQREERRVSDETGVALWQVRAELRTRRDTVALAQRLSADGQRIEKGWKFIVAGASSGDDALRLAETIRLYAAADAKVRVGRTPYAPFDVPGPSIG